MDYQKAIEYFDKELKRDCMVLSPMLEGKKSVRAQFFETAISAMKELDQYKQLGTLEEVRMAVERQIPESPTLDGDGYAPDGTFVWDEWLCPNCKCRYELEYDDYDYCPTCGQHIGWEGDKT